MELITVALHLCCVLYTHINIDEALMSLSVLSCSGRETLIYDRLSQCSESETEKRHKYCTGGSDQTFFFHIIFDLKKYVLVSFLRFKYFNLNYFVVYSYS